MDLVRVGEVLAIAYVFWRQMEPQPTTDRAPGKAIRTKTLLLGCKRDFRLGVGASPSTSLYLPREVRV